MTMKKLFTLTLFLFSALAYCQTTEISGQVLDAEFNKEPLAFAEVKVQGLDIQAITDEKGNYTLELAPGSYNLEFAFIGYESRLVSAEVEVKSKHLQLDPVVLEGKKYRVDYDLTLSDNTEAPKQE
jgi:hypothetical protein